MFINPKDGYLRHFLGYPLDEVQVYFVAGRKNEFLCLLPHQDVAETPLRANPTRELGIARGGTYGY
jgi:hypothetical protein